MNKLEDWRKNNNMRETFDEKTNLKVGSDDWKKRKRTEILHQRWSLKELDEEIDRAYVSENPYDKHLWRLLVDIRWREYYKDVANYHHKAKITNIKERMNDYRS